MSAMKSKGEKPIDFDKPIVQVGGGVAEFVGKLPFPPRLFGERFPNLRYAVQLKSGVCMPVDQFGASTNGIRRVKQKGGN
jgi:hypothetical protein